MILPTNSRITSALCYLHPVLVELNYHDATHVMVTLDVDNALTALCLICLSAIPFMP